MCVCKLSRFNRVRLLVMRRILEWLHALLPGHLPNPGIEPVSHISCIGRWFFTTSATWEAHMYACIPSCLQFLPI